MADNQAINENEEQTWGHVGGNIYQNNATGQTYYDFDNQLMPISPTSGQEGFYNFDMNQLGSQVGLSPEQIWMMQQGTTGANSALSAIKSDYLRDRVPTLEEYAQSISQTTGTPTTPAQAQMWYDWAYHGAEPGSAYADPYGRPVTRASNYDYDTVQQQIRDIAGDPNYDVNWGAQDYMSSLGKAPLNTDQGRTFQFLKALNSLPIDVNSNYGPTDLLLRGNAMGIAEDAGHQGMSYTDNSMWQQYLPDQYQQVLYNNPSMTMMGNGIQQYVDAGVPLEAIARAKEQYYGQPVRWDETSTLDRVMPYVGMAGSTILGSILGAGALGPILGGSAAAIGAGAGVGSATPGAVMEYNATGNWEQALRDIGEAGATGAVTAGVGELASPITEAAQGLASELGDVGSQFVGDFAGNLPEAGLNIIQGQDVGSSLLNAGISTGTDVGQGLAADYLQGGNANLAPTDYAGGYDRDALDALASADTLSDYGYTQADIDALKWADQNGYDFNGNRVMPGAPYSVTSSPNASLQAAEGFENAGQTQGMNFGPGGLAPVTTSPGAGLAAMEASATGGNAGGGFENTQVNRAIANGDMIPSGYHQWGEQGGYDNYGYSEGNPNSPGYNPNEQSIPWDKMAMQMMNGILPGLMSNDLPAEANWSRPLPTGGGATSGPQALTPDGMTIPSNFSQQFGAVRPVMENYTQDLASMVKDNPDLLNNPQVYNMLVEQLQGAGYNPKRYAGLNAEANVDAVMGNSGGLQAGSWEV